MSELDYQMALVLQHQIDEEEKHELLVLPVLYEEDLELAKRLQKQFEEEVSTDKDGKNLTYESKKTENTDNGKCLVDPSWEVIDPTPDIHNLFVVFNKRFFWNELTSVAVSWSKRMTLCAGLCSYQKNNGLCQINLSEPLLKLRPRKDLIETLLHEMIHAYLYITRNDKDRQGHGPEFHKHMYRINNEAGTNISVYHEFHDEVALYRKHWWRCDGPCQQRHPFFGMVGRAINRAPGPQDRWWDEHSKSCGGVFTKVQIKQPEKPPTKPAPKPTKKEKKKSSSGDISKYLTNTNPPNNKVSTPVPISPPKPNTVYGVISLNSDSCNITFSQNGKVLNASTVDFNKTGSSSMNTPEYSVVRNHWTNKFPSEKKRTSNSPPPSEVIRQPKISKLNETSLCPVCNTSVATNDMNNHLDECLEGQRNEKDCFICNKTIAQNDYQNHVTQCSEQTFRNENKSSIVECSDDDEEEHEGKEDSGACSTKFCSICELKFPTEEFNEHAMKCLNKMYSDLEKEYGVNIEEKIDCLACGENVCKSDLSAHLDECMNDVFNNTTEVIAEDDCDNSNNKEFNCPFCMKLILEKEMNGHIKVCLNIDGDEDDQKSKEHLRRSLGEDFNLEW